MRQAVWEEEQSNATRWSRMFFHTRRSALSHFPNDCFRHSVAAAQGATHPHREPHGEEGYPTRPDQRDEGSSARFSFHVNTSSSFFSEKRDNRSHSSRALTSAFNAPT